MLTSEQVSVTDTATALTSGDAQKLLISNAGANEVYLGDATVTAATGFRLLANATIPFDFEVPEGESLYVVCDTAETATLHVLARGRKVRAAATLETSLTGTHNDLVFTAVEDGSEGNLIHVTYIVAGAETPLTVGVHDFYLVTVFVETDVDGEPLSTADEIKAAIVASSTVSALVTAADAGGNDGSGVVTAMDSTNLRGGSD